MKSLILSGLLMLALAFTLAACADQVNPLEVTTHPEGWRSGQMHGLMVLESAGKAESCSSCHGANFRGGNSGVSCMSSGCHSTYPHMDGFAHPETGGRHVQFVREQVGWDITTCKSCHGEDYAGKGFEQKDCTTCHTQPAGPEACNTCHGSEQNAAPPRDLHDRTSPSYITVGAHQAHVGEGTFSDMSAISCESCHVMPAHLTSPGHIDNGAPQAEVRFGEIATQNGLVAPVWDRASGTCSNTYCHGAFTFERADSPNPWGYAEEAITGTPNDVVWTAGDAANVTCGSCHGLPPEGHRLPDNRVDVSDCSSCHPRVVDRDMNILDKTLHVNGRVDVF